LCLKYLGMKLSWNLLGSLTSNVRPSLDHEATIGSQVLISSNVFCESVKKVRKAGSELIILGERIDSRTAQLMEFWIFDHVTGVRLCIIPTRQDTRLVSQSVHVSCTD
jgi:hypothetical protein